MQPGKAYVSTPYIGHAIAQWATDRFWTEWLWMRLVLRSEERMLRKSERKRAKKEQAELDADEQHEMESALVETLGGPA